MTAAYYFAYGSNLYPPRLRARVASARPAGSLALAGWRLCFHKRGRDGSGKCDMLHTGDGADRVFGAVYRFAAAQLPALDAAEDAGRSYHRWPLAVAGYAGLFCYLADPGHVDPGLQPFDWYLAYVRAGAAWHGFPAPYQQALAAVPSRADPDPARAARHRIAAGYDPR